MVNKRMMLVALIAAVALLQAWDSGVFAAGSNVIALVLAGMVGLVVALLMGLGRRAGLGGLIIGLALIVVARVIAPVRLNELFIIFPIVVMPLLFEQIQRQRQEP